MILRLAMGGAKWLSMIVAAMCVMDHRYDAGAYYVLVALFWQWQTTDYDAKHGPLPWEDE